MAFPAFRNRLIALSACAVFCAMDASAAPAASQRALDQTRVHGYYHDGEFDKVIKVLDAFQKSGRACSHAESVFVAKHLAVVYAANPGTRELGRYHMFRLLDLAPESDLLDMFVGEEVSGVFEKVGKEYSLRKGVQVPAASPTANAAANAKPSAAANAKSAPAAMAKPSPAAMTKPAYADAPPVRPASATAKPAPSSSSSASSSAPAQPRPVIAYKPRARPVAALPARAAARDSVKTAVAEPASRPAWKEPGMWIGGGAALAVVAFTLFYSGSNDAPEGKTYVVPATASR